MAAAKKQAKQEAPAKPADDKGYVGSVPDPTPNSAYTVAGRLAGEPTPETDEKAKAAADGVIGPPKETG